MTIVAVLGHYSEGDKRPTAPWKVTEFITAGGRGKELSPSGARAGLETWKEAGPAAQRWMGGLESASEESGVQEVLVLNSVVGVVFGLLDIWPDVGERRGS